MMNLGECVRVVREARDERDIVVTSMSTAREWMAAGPLQPLDFVHVPSSMGQSTSLALGLALARPDLRVVVCNGDGSLLMNLGSLVTIASQAPKNLVVLVFENGVYEVTGAQPTPSGASIDFAGMARAAGITSVYSFDSIAAWPTSAREIFERDGPTFVVLKVASIPGSAGPRSPSPAPERARKFAAAVAAV